MRSERQEITHRGRRWATLTTEWWNRLGAFCLLLAATAIASPAQSDPLPVTFTTLLNFDVTNGVNPVAPNNLVQGRDGNLYGVANSGGTGAYLRVRSEPVWHSFQNHPHRLADDALQLLFGNGLY
jgi:hypothetical protein